MQNARSEPADNAVEIAAELLRRLARLGRLAWLGRFGPHARRHFQFDLLVAAKQVEF
jgi:hypothetical protein